MGKTLASSSFRTGKYKTRTLHVAHYMEILGNRIFAHARLRQNFRKVKPVKMLHHEMRTKNIII